MPSASTSTRFDSSRRRPIGAGFATPAQHSSSRTTYRADSDGCTSASIDWKFNGWAKYDNHARDNRLPRKIARWLGIPRWVPRVRTRAGAAPRRDGRGRHRRQRTRNPARDRGMPAQRDPGPQPRARSLASSSRSSLTTLAFSHVVWLGRGIEGDDTHGHVDDLARFVDARTVVTVVEPRHRRTEPRTACR